MLELIVYYTQIYLSLIGVIALIFFSHQFIAMFCNRFVFSNKTIRKIYYYASIPGTVLHELAHVIMCIVFAHKIISIQWLPSPDNSRGGRVTHKYNPHSIYQSVGGFFIGIAPGVLVTIIIYFCFGTKTLTEALELIVSGEDIAMKVVLCWLAFFCVPSASDFKNALTGALSVTIVLSVAVPTMQLLGYHLSDYLYAPIIFYILSLFGWVVLISLRALLYFLGVFGKNMN